MNSRAYALCKPPRANERPRLPIRSRGRMMKYDYVLDAVLMKKVSGDGQSP